MAPARTSARTILLRGPRRSGGSGAGGLFPRWFGMVDDCPGCGLHFEREPGYWTGAIAVNFALVGTVFTIVFVGALVLTVPDVPVGPVLALTVPIALLGPLVAFPWSRTLWVALDRAVLSRLDDGPGPRR